MKKHITSAVLFLLLTFNTAYAQFGIDDVKFWIGEGSARAVLVVDFRDNTSDPSFAWGYRFNPGEGKTFADMLMAVQEADENFEIVLGYGNSFLEDITYNNHAQLAGNPDWWSTWSGTSLEDLGGNMGISEVLEDTHWYGTSYGFSPEPVKPTVTYAAYNSLWFTEENLTYSIGQGANSAVVVIDFAQGENSSLAWKINFDGTITLQDALALISQVDNNLEVTYNGSNSNISYQNLNATTWAAFQGSNLSDWTISNFTTPASNGSWLGISAGDVYHRPFTPIQAPENEAGTEDFKNYTLKAYPNPATDFLTWHASSTIKHINIYNTTGQKISSISPNHNEYTLTVRDFTKGLYFFEVLTENESKTMKIAIK